MFDLTKDRALLVRPDRSCGHIFWADAVVSVLNSLGITDAIPSLTAPTDTARPWLKPSAANDAPAQLFFYGAGQWRPATPALVSAYQNNAAGGLIIVDGSVSSAKITDAAITTDKIADGAVTTVKIADGSITKEKLASAVLTKGMEISDTVGLVINTFATFSSLTVTNDQLVSFSGASFSVPEEGWYDISASISALLNVGPNTDAFLVGEIIVAGLIAARGSSNAFNDISVSRELSVTPSISRYLTVGTQVYFRVKGYFFGGAPVASLQASIIKH